MQVTGCTEVFWPRYIWQRGSMVFPTVSTLGYRWDLCSPGQQGIPASLLIAVVTLSIIRVSAGLCGLFALTWEVTRRGKNGFKAQCQEVKLLCMYTHSSNPTRESTALTVLHWDRDRRMSITMVTAGHHSSAATTTPHSNSSITYDTPSGNQHGWDKQDRDGAASVTAS